MASRRLTPSVILRAVCVGFLFGIAVASYEEIIDANIWPFAVVAAVLFLIISFLEKRWILFAVVALFSVFAFWIYESNLPDQNSVHAYTGQSYHVEATVVDLKRSDARQHLILFNVTLDDQDVEDKIIVFAPLFPRYKYGDRVSLRCDLDAPEPIEDFQYDRYLASKNIYATCYAYSAPIVLANEQGNPVISVLLKSREGIIGKIDETFGEPHASLLAGLLLGEQRFTDAWEEKFVRTGTTHIVAASGYNVAVVTFIAFGILTYFGLRRKRAFAFIIAAIVGYVILAGAEAAVIRAGVMGALVLISYQLGRKSTMTNVLLLTACLMLLANPLLLRDDVGFQLSMISTIGLIYFTPTLEKRLKFIPEKFTIRETITATLAATLFTLPIIIFRFGRLSLVSVFANLFILPFVPFTMAFGAGAIVIGFANPTLGILSSGPAWAALELMLFFVESLASLSFSVIEFAI